MVTNRSKNGRYPIIAVDGPGGAGKTTFAQRLAESLDDFVLIHGDDYYDPHPHGHSPTPGFLNVERIARGIGAQLDRGDTVLLHDPFNWRVGSIATHRIVVDGGVVYEGIKTLDLPISWDFKIWVDAPREHRKYRFVYERTEAQRRVKGRSEAELAAHFDFWADEAEAYGHRIDPGHNTDCIVDGLADFETQLRTVQACFDNFGLTEDTQSDS